MVTKDEIEDIDAGIIHAAEELCEQLRTQWPGATVAFIFPFILYCILQRKFVEGSALSGIKG